MSTEIHFAPPKKPWNDSIPQGKYQPHTTFQNQNRFFDSVSTMGIQVVPKRISSTVLLGCFGRNSLAIPGWLQGIHLPWLILMGAPWGAGHPKHPCSLDGFINPLGQPANPPGFHVWYSSKRTETEGPLRNSSQFQSGCATRWPPLRRDDTLFFAREGSKDCDGARGRIGPSLFYSMRPVDRVAGLKQFLPGVRAAAISNQRQAWTSESLGY